MYFRLHDYCHLIRGAKRGAIYNTQTGSVLSVNQGAAELITDCRQHSLEDLMDVTDETNRCYVAFLESLAAKGFGSLYVNIPADSAIPLPDSPVQLDFLWLELTGLCNNRCLHCYAASGPAECGDAVPYDIWLSVISQARQAGAAAIQLIGGEPLLYPRWRELVEHAKAEGYDVIEIFTNATLITDSDIAFFQQQGVQIATTVYADCGAIHDGITLNSGSFAKTYGAIEKILAARIPLRIASIIMKPNENEAAGIMDLCERLGVEVNPPDVVRPTGRGDDEKLRPDNYKKPSIRPPFYTDAESFAKARQWHPCLAGKLAVTSTGDVIPCIFARSQVCGNVLSQSLADIISGDRLQECWQTTKDMVDKCMDCEYRYACSDCRPLAQGNDDGKRWLACSRECLYNPYTGIWADK